MVGIALLVVLLGAIPGYAKKPVADADGPYVGTRAETVTLDGSGSSDPDGTISNYEWQIDGTQVYSGTSATYDLNLSGYNLGDYEVKLKVTDNAGQKKDDTTTLTVNNAPPVAEANGPYSGMRTETVTLDSAGSSDPDSTIVNYEWRVDGTQVYSGSNPTYGLDLSGYSKGGHTVTLIVTDDDGTTDDDTATLTVNNAPPVAEANGPYSGMRTETVTLDSAGSSDPDSTIVNYEWRVDGTQVYSGSNPTYGLDLSGYSKGGHTVTLIVTDDDGTTDDDTATLTVNNAPPVANDDSDTTPEDTPVTTDVVANDSDVDGDSLTAVLDTTTSNGTLTLNSDGSFTYAPNSNFNGTDTFTYHANDGTAASNVATVTITVRPVNDPPVANDDSDTTPEDTPVSTNVVANDTDADGMVVASAVAIVSGPRSGSVVNNGDGTVTYTPDENFNGSDSFTYTVKDNGGATSNVAIVTINAGAVNDPPMAQMDSEITDENMPVTIPVLANDSDPDGDRLTVESVTQPSNGTVTNNGTDVTYTPYPDFNGMDTFTYTVSDGNGGTDTTMVMVAVAVVNGPPVAQEDSGITDEDVAVTIRVLANDSDPDGDRLTVESVRQPLNGTVRNNGTDVTYTPYPDFNGTDTFTYTVSDGNGGTDSATVTVDVLKSEVTGEGGGDGQSEWKLIINELADQEPTFSVRFLKRDTDDIFWLVLAEPEEKEGSYYILTLNSTVLEELALSADIQPTETRAGEPLEVGIELADSGVVGGGGAADAGSWRAAGWPWIRVTSPDLPEGAVGGGGTADLEAVTSFSGRYEEDTYWLGIDTGALAPGRYNFWIVYGEGETAYVPIIIVP